MEHFLAGISPLLDEMLRLKKKLQLADKKK